MMRSFLLLIFTMLSVSMTAQRTCGSADLLEKQLLDDPSMEERMQAIERFTTQYLKSPLRSNADQQITIPIVFHIVYSSEEGNVSQAQIESQLRILNEDFQRLNADTTGTPEVFQPVAADLNITFCLATIDPDGNPTTGITRTATSVESFSSSSDDIYFDARGGKDAWDPSSYLNFWVCNLANGLLGFAQYPGGPEASDGVVVGYRYFGDIGTAVSPFNLGRTGTHEVGHYFNLRHIWGNGDCSVDDLVGDTPLAGSPNYDGLPCSFPGANSCGSGAEDLPDMFQNYMDYSDDGCMNMFTEGQSDRVRALFAFGGARYDLLLSNACGVQEVSCSDNLQNGDETGVDCGGSQCSPCPCNVGPLTLDITFDDYPTETSWDVRNSQNQVVVSSPIYDGQTPSMVTETIDLTPGDYTFNMYDAFGDGLCCEYGQGAFQLTDAEGTLIVEGSSFGTVSSTAFCLAPELCPDSLNWLSESYGDTAKAAAFLESSVALSSAGPYLFEAPRITLRPGFTVSSGTGFTARPVGCIPEEGDTRQLSLNTESRLGNLETYTSNGFRLRVIPNPAQSFAQITIIKEEASGAEPAQISIFNAMGQQVFLPEAMMTTAPGHYNMDINLTGYPQGLYWVVARMGIHREVVTLQVY